jgi:uncharacterized protein DUF6580
MKLRNRLTDSQGFSRGVLRKTPRSFGTTPNARFLGCGWENRHRVDSNSFPPVSLELAWGQSITWLGFAAIALIGYWLRERETVARVGVAALAGPTAFFLISNFGVWLGWRMYPATWDGLITCYVAALPFYRNSLVSSVAYTALLFSANYIY